MRIRAVFALLMLAAALAGCAAPTTRPPEPAPRGLPAVTPSPVIPVEPSPLPSVAVLMAITPSPSPVPTPDVVCSPDGVQCVYAWEFPFSRPIPEQGNQCMDPTYRFGSTQNGNRVPHHGVEFTNPSGTPVLAVADGDVAFAGWDDGTQVSPWRDYYGNVIVIRHIVNGESQPVFSVYAHLSVMQVTAGQRVSAGEQIGLVGASGGAQGSHLHFEIRYGGWGYGNSLNPVLWLAPLEGHGALAVRITDSNGNAVNPSNVRVQWYKDRSKEANTAYALEPYVQTEPWPVQPHLRLGEIFALDDLPAEGVYRLSFSAGGNLVVLEDVVVQPGRLTMLTLTTR